MFYKFDKIHKTAKLIDKKSASKMSDDSIEWPIQKDTHKDRQTDGYIGRQTDGHNNQTNIKTNKLDKRIDTRTN